MHVSHWQFFLLCSLFIENYTFIFTLEFFISFEKIVVVKSLQKSVKPVPC